MHCGILRKWNRFDVNRYSPAECDNAMHQIGYASHPAPWWSIGPTGKWSVFSIGSTYDALPHGGRFDMCSHDEGGACRDGQSTDTFYIIHLDENHPAFVAPSTAFNVAAEPASTDAATFCDAGTPGMSVALPAAPPPPPSPPPSPSPPRVECFVRRQFGTLDFVPTDFRTFDLVVTPITYVDGRVEADSDPTDSYVVGCNAYAVANGDSIAGEYSADCSIAACSKACFDALRDASSPSYAGPHGPCLGFVRDEASNSCQFYSNTGSGSSFIPSSSGSAWFAFSTDENECPTPLSGTPAVGIDVDLAGPPSPPTFPPPPSPTPPPPSPPPPPPSPPTVFTLVNLIDADPSAGELCPQKPGPFPLGEVTTAAECKAAILSEFPDAHIEHPFIGSHRYSHGYRCGMKNSGAIGWTDVPFEHMSGVYVCRNFGHSSIA